MLAGLYRASQQRRSLALRALLLLVTKGAMAAGIAAPVRDRHVEIGEVIRVTAQRAVPLLAGLEARALPAVAA